MLGIPVGFVVSLVNLLRGGDRTAAIIGLVISGALGLLLFGMPILKLCVN